MTSLWYGAQAEVHIGDAIDVSEDSDLKSQMSEEEDYSAQVRDITFSGAEADVSVLNVFGDQLKEESRPEVKTVDFTMSFEDPDMMTELHDDISDVDQGEDPDFRRIRGGDHTGDRKDRAILFHLEDGQGNQVNLLLNNAWFTSGGEVSLDADGTAELSISAAGLVSDLYVEDNIGDY